MPEPDDAEEIQGGRRALAWASLFAAFGASAAGRAAAAPARRAPPATTPEGEAIARAAILDCIYRYARGIDRHDPELALTAYHGDALDDHGFYIGPAKAFVYRTVKTHAHLAAHQHYMVNHLVEFDPGGRVAAGETYYLMVGRLRSDDSVQMGGGRYADRYELRHGRWAIAERLCIIDWSSDPSKLAELHQAYLSGTQDRTDPSYRRPVVGGRPQRNLWPSNLPPESKPR